MCILSYIPRGVELDSDIEIDLYNGGVSNPDGHGWAIASDSGVMIVGKSLDLDQALEEFAKARTAHSGPALFHSRWATHGSVKTDNCHPFYVGGPTGNGMTVLAHNGVLPSKAHPLPGDDRSDSCLFAEDIMPRQWKRLHRQSVRDSIGEWIGKGNKFVILSVDPRYGDQDGWIINEGSGMWDGPTGVWHSNGDYRYNWTKAYVAASAATSTANFHVGQYPEIDDDRDEPCVYCDQKVNNYAICTACGTCQDCLETSDDCLCYSGSSVLRDLEESLNPDSPIPFLPVED